MIFSKPIAVLSIAGSDSGGGAGIQADLRTFAAHGLLGTTAITAITAQNTLGVQAVHPVPAPMVAAQIDSVLSDLPIRAAKTGMLTNRAIIDTVSASWASRPIPLVIDPVMVATSGDRLLDQDAQHALTNLLKRATVITPNLPEASALSGLPLSAPATEHADAIARLSPATVIIKGGHREAQKRGIDWVRLPDGQGFELHGAWQETRSTHGTGCTFSAAIAANLALGLELVESLRAAKAYLTEALAHAVPFGQGHGPVNHLHALRAPTP